MRKAAQHVTAMKLTQRATRAYVAGLIAEQGDRPQRRVTPGRISRQMRTFRENVTAAAWQRRAVAALHEADAETREAVRREVEGLRAWSVAFLTKIPKR